MSVRFSRFAFLLFCCKRWLRLLRFMANLPRPVFRIRFFAPLWDFIFGIVGREYRGAYTGCKRCFSLFLRSNDCIEVSPLWFYILLNLCDVLEGFEDALELLDGVILIRKFTTTQADEEFHQVTLSKEFL